MLNMTAYQLILVLFKNIPEIALVRVPPPERRVAIGLAAGSPASPVGLARFAILVSDYPEVGLAGSGPQPAGP